MADETPADSFMRALKGSHTQQMGFAAVLLMLGLLGWYGYRDNQDNQL